MAQVVRTQFARTLRAVSLAPTNAVSVTSKAALIREIEQHYEHALRIPLEDSSDSENIFEGILVVIVSKFDLKKWVYFALKLPGQNYFSFAVLEAEKFIQRFGRARGSVFEALSRVLEQLSFDTGTDADFNKMISNHQITLWNRFEQRRQPVCVDLSPMTSWDSLAMRLRKLVKPVRYSLKPSNGDDYYIILIEYRVGRIYLGIKWGYGDSIGCYVLNRQAFLANTDRLSDDARAAFRINEMVLALPTQAVEAVNDVNAFWKWVKATQEKKK